MACGCPVVVSNTSSLQEVVGDASILVDPENVKNIAEGIKKVLNLDEDERRVLIEKGLKQAQKFSWEKCAKKTLEVLELVSNKSKS
ncbi:hypothetical protein A2Z23_01660 [Candidatus Curtissbacteria bacterium RBG_16_39_7]|uniref:Glycosyl transferase family 1 domain-containing protein n=1 Tax=Candidatus Curtissbacteria bacterium RBG_16_39_7 TaxID=1797707 RepID=A0A1F5G537_9BACT|nr:MAG: hypothetical protein A2Z23_01660 [Candidatus Curtissbacteria bacterium RBG_16_39_7]